MPCKPGYMCDSCGSVMGTPKLLRAHLDECEARLTFVAVDNVNDDAEAGAATVGKDEADEAAAPAVRRGKRKRLTKRVKKRYMTDEFDLKKVLIFALYS